jgi:hypothetical protein
MEMNGGISETMKGCRNDWSHKETYSMNGAHLKIQFLEHDVQSKRVLTKPVL